MQKNKVFTILAIVLVVIFAVCVAFKGFQGSKPESDTNVSVETPIINQNNNILGGTTNGFDNNSPNSSGSNNQNNNQNNVINQGNNQNSNQNNNQNNNQEQNKDNELTYDYAYEVLLESLNKLDDISFSYIEDKEIKTPISTQKIKTYCDKKVNEANIRTYADCDTIFGHNYYKEQSLFINSLTIKRTDDFEFDGKVNMDKATSKTYAYNQYKEEMKIYDIYELGLVFNANNMSILYYQKIGNVYQIKIKYDPSFVADGYKQIYHDTGLVNDVEFTEMFFTFKIDIKTGNLLSIESQEVFKGSFVFLGIPFDCTANSKIAYSYE